MTILKLQPISDVVFQQKRINTPIEEAFEVINSDTDVTLGYIFGAREFTARLNWKAVLNISEMHQMDESRGVVRNFPHADKNKAVEALSHQVRGNALLIS